jgi:3-hydroxymyristoyl/3-hydroxydecanoyl-(acyl carrier protein) dehydratase
MKQRSDWRDWPVLAIRAFALDHPALAGHFPAYPVLPGVLLLDWACQELAGDQPVAVREARFVRPCGPGSQLALRARTRDGVSSFAITLGEGGDEAVVVSGTLVMDASDPASP